MAHGMTYNDTVLFLSLVYSCADVVMEWGTFSTCSRPIHMWLVTSYCSVLIFRLAHVTGTLAAAAASGAAGQAGGEGRADAVGDFLLDLRQKGLMPRAAAAFIWAVALPGFTVWTVLGTWWLWTITQETPQCMPSETHFWFSALWLALCYAWIVIHTALGVAAWILERRVRRAEVELRELEDDDVRSRWGQVSQISSYTALAGAAGPSAGEGLSPAAIKALPAAREITGEEAASGCECPICLTELQEGDMVRRLPGCGHNFHRSCIDLWLLRRADCPLCKGRVATDGAATVGAGPAGVAVEV